MKVVISIGGALNETPEGWLLIYRSQSDVGCMLFYSACASLLDLEIY
jgi:hypothetical protein